LLRLALAAVKSAFHLPAVCARSRCQRLGVEATIIIVLGAMIAAVTAKLRSLIQHNTRLVLQALAGLRPPSD